MKKISAVFLLLSPILAYADPPAVGESLFVCRVPFTQDKSGLRISEGVTYSSDAYTLVTAADFGLTDRLMLTAMVPFTSEKSLSPARLEAIYQLYTNQDGTLHFSGGGGLNASLEESNAALYLSANIALRRYHINAALTGRGLEGVDQRVGEVALGLFVPIWRFAIAAEGAVAVGEDITETISIGALAQLTEQLSLGGALVTALAEDDTTRSAVVNVAWQKGLGR